MNNSLETTEGQQLAHYFTGVELYHALKHGTLEASFMYKDKEYKIVGYEADFLHTKDGDVAMKIIFRHLDLEEVTMQPTLTFVWLRQGNNLILKTEPIEGFFDPHAIPECSESLQRRLTDRFRQSATTVLPTEGDIEEID